MHAQHGKQVADTLQAEGLSLALTEDNALKVAPACKLTPALRDLIRTNKPALVAWLITPAANDPAPDPDRWCWPYSAAMNTAEIDTFAARLARFTDWGLDLPAGERLADRLVMRDREKDDRALCLECTHLQRGWRCANGQQASASIRAWDAQLPGDCVGLLQRCEGFTHSVDQQGGNHGQA